MPSLVLPAGTCSFLSVPSCSAADSSTSEQSTGLGKRRHGREREEQGGQAQMLLQCSAALSFLPAELLMISEVFEHTAEVEEEEKKSRGAMKRNG